MYRAFYEDELLELSQEESDERDAKVREHLRNEDYYLLSKREIDIEFKRLDAKYKRIHNFKNEDTERTRIRILKLIDYSAERE